MSRLSAPFLPVISVHSNVTAQCSISTYGQCTFNAIYNSTNTVTLDASRNI